MPAAVNIDPITGAIRAGTIQIVPGLSLCSFQAVLASRGDREVVRNGVWESYGLKSATDPVIGMILTFKGDRLAEVRLSIENPMTSWGGWSLESEVDRKNQIERILCADLGELPHIFDWGEVCSEIDPKTGFAQAVIRYTARGPRSIDD